MHNSTSAFIALGSNLPFNGVSGAALLAQAAAALRSAGLRLCAASGVWQTAAWPSDSNQPDYVNAVIELDPGSRTPQQLYETLREIEIQFGRDRRERYAARTLDLDIVAMEGSVGSFGELVLPHPRLQERTFVLAPLTEIASEWRHPLLGRTPADFLAEISSRGEYRRIGDLAI